MGLRLKFNLAMLLTFLVGITVTGFISFKMLQNNAREEVLQQASLMMESALSIRYYTVNEIRPLLTEQLKENFLPQTVPAYAATRNIEQLRLRYPEYSYKEATLNPTNPSSRATDWETSIVEHFRNNSNSTELIGEHNTATGRSLYLARPIQIKNEKCLVCHGKIEDAPETMLARYGRSNGFGWKVNEVVGAQIVNIPMSLPLERAMTTFKAFILSISGVFIAIILILNYLLHAIVIKPVINMSNIAEDVSMGNFAAPDYAQTGKDEISRLAMSLNRMRRSLVSAMKMLDD